MKKMLLMLFAIIFCIRSVGQAPSPGTQMTKEDYLQKSKSQRTTGWILLGGGSALVLGGSLLFWENFELFSDKANSGETGGLVMVGLGGAAMVTSIPFFIAAGKNKNKAAGMEVSMGLKMEDGMMVSKNSLRNQSYPALSFRLHLK